MFILSFMFFPILDPQKSHENPRFLKLLQNLVPRDHAQMIERKILCRIALKRPLYDQIRPYFFQKYASNFDPPSTAFFEKFKQFVSRIVGPSKNMKIHPLPTPLKTQTPGTMPR